MNESETVATPMVSFVKAIQFLIVSDDEAEARAKLDEYQAERLDKDKLQVVGQAFGRGPKTEKVATSVMRPGYSARYVRTVWVTQAHVPEWVASKVDPTKTATIAWTDPNPNADWNFAPTPPTPLKVLRAAIPALATWVKCPEGCFPQSVDGTVIHLNDTHRWTREEIADWLETLDCDLSFPVKVD